MSSSVGIIIPNIWKIKVMFQNHQPDPMVFPWFSYGSPMVVLWFSMICSKPPGKWVEITSPKARRRGAWSCLLALQNDHIGTVRSRLWYPQKTWWLIYVLYGYVYIYICRYVWTCWDFLKTSTMVVYPKNNSYNLGMGQTQPIRMAHFGMLPKSRRDLSSRVNRFTPLCHNKVVLHIPACISEVSGIHKHLV